MQDGLSYLEQRPWPGLACRVRTVWIQHIGPQPYLQRNLPTGGVELHCPIGGLPRVLGPLTVAEVQLIPAGTTVVGVRFWPGGASPLLGLPVRELIDSTVDTDELWGDDAAWLGELLARAPGPEAALDLLQRHLLDRQAHTEDPDPLVAHAVRRLMPWIQLDVASLATAMSISTSQLRRRFLDSVGLGPKSLQRTLRFQGYLALAQAAAAPASPPVSLVHAEARSVGPRPHGQLSDLAAEAGYADHPHLSRECLRLTGITPRELLIGGTDQCGCQHDHAASYLPFLAGRPRARRSA